MKTLRPLDPSGDLQEIVDRIYQTSVSIHPQTECWELSTRWANERGHKKFRVKGRVVYAHRAFYTTYVGMIPQDAVLDHKCKNPACCNPSHLEPVTVVENTRRGKGAWMLDDAGQFRRKVLKPREAL